MTEFLLPPTIEEIKDCIVESLEAVPTDHPILLEIGPGISPYTLQIAKRDPSITAVAIDRLSKDTLLWEWQNGLQVFVPTSLPQNFYFCLGDIEAAKMTEPFVRQIQAVYCFFPDQREGFIQAIVELLGKITAINPQVSIIIATEKTSNPTLEGNSEENFSLLIKGLQTLGLGEPTVTLVSIDEFEQRFRETETSRQFKKTPDVKEVRIIELNAAADK